MMTIGRLQAIESYMRRDGTSREILLKCGGELIAEVKRLRGALEWIVAHRADDLHENRLLSSHAAEALAEPDHGPPRHLVSATGGDAMTDKNGRAMKRAFRTSWNGVDSIVASTTASKARYITYRSAVDAGYRACRFHEIRVVRAPQHDAWAAQDDTKRCWCAAELPKP